MDRQDDTPRPHLPTTEPLERRKMAASWVRIAASTFRKLGDEELAVKLETLVSHIPDPPPKDV